MITIALIFHHTILFKIQNMTILTRQERERLVIDLYYNQGKTYRQISKEARISPRDIGVILNKVMEEKKTEGLKEERQQQDNIESEKNQECLSLSSQAYKLFSEGKTPLEVAVTLNLRESEATEFYKEYWRLKQLHNLIMVYEETKGDIDPFLTLYKLAKRKGIGVRHVVDLLAIANNDLPSIEERFKKLRNDVSTLQAQKHICKRNLYQLNNQIPSTTKLLNSFRMSCGRERRELENLQNEKERLEAIVAHFKSNNEEYLKIQQTVAEEVSKFLADGKVLLQFALASVIEAIRGNLGKCNNLLVCNTSSSSTSTAAHDLSLSHIDAYKDMILDEAKELYDKLLEYFTNSIMDNAVGSSSSSDSKLSSTFNLSPYNQRDTHIIEESEIHHNSKGDSDD
jgi:transposase